MPNSDTPVGSVSHLCLTRIIFLFVAVSVMWSCDAQLVVGFKATPNPSAPLFQSLLNDSTGNFSLGFLRVNTSQLVLSVVHLPSSEPVWQANTSRLARWSDRTELAFNGSLVISDPSTGLFWSTGTKGDRLVLLNTSNLQVRDSGSGVLWQSFEFPGNTLVVNQNFTSAMALVSSNGVYCMRLGGNFVGLYAKLGGEEEQIYWKHTAMQAKADIVEGNGPIHALVNSDGFLGLYQHSTVPVDVQPFSSFQRAPTGYLLLRLDPDGNLKGYYWDGSTWILDYTAITHTCELPSPCGSYSVCTAGAGCSCLDNATEFQNGECLPPVKGGPNLCGGGGARNDDFWVLRRKGVELPYEELMGYVTTSSEVECESLCENNCSCWGAVYNNASGFCYGLDYPIQTLVGVADETKVGYFKVRVAARKKMDTRLTIGFGVLGGALLILISIKGWMMWSRRRKGVKLGAGIGPGPYKDLNSASFRSIEISNSGRK